jgi:hypothetical protein
VHLAPEVVVTRREKKLASYFGASRDDVRTLENTDTQKYVVQTFVTYHQAGTYVNILCAYILFCAYKSCRQFSIGICLFLLLLLCCVVVHCGKSPYNI